jgi:hypothetical protein
LDLVTPESIGKVEAYDSRRRQLCLQDLPLQAKHLRGFCRWQKLVVSLSYDDAVVEVTMWIFDPAIFEIAVSLGDGNAQSAKTLTDAGNCRTLQLSHVHPAIAK